MTSRKIGKKLLSKELIGSKGSLKKALNRKSQYNNSRSVSNTQDLDYRKTERQIVESPHVHTPHSDGKSTIYTLVAEAGALGLEYIGFSDHWDPLKISDGNFNDKYPVEPFEDSYLLRRDGINDLILDHQNEDNSSIELNIADGAELEYYLGREDELEEAIERAEFDYLYLSVHKNKHGEDYRKMEPEGQKDAMSIIGSYFRDLREAYRFADEIDDIKVIAHPDGIERNKTLRNFFEDKDFYKTVLNEEYNSIVDKACQNDVLSELNGRILLRTGETEWFNVLSNADIPYAIGTDTHRSGAKEKYNWVNETQARINILEMKIPELGREPEKVLENVDTSKIEIPRWMAEKVKLDEDPRKVLK